MSDPDKKSLDVTTDNIVALITNQDHVSQKWIEFLILVESGLFVAFGFLEKSDDQEFFVLNPLSNIAILLIPILGIVVAHFLTQIIVRERNWQIWYVEQFRKLPVTSKTLFPDSKEIAEFLKDRSNGFISDKVLTMSWIIIGVWAVVEIGLLYRIIPLCSCHT